MVPHEFTTHTHYCCCCCPRFHICPCTFIHLLGPMCALLVGDNNLCVPNYCLLCLLRCCAFVYTTGSVLPKLMMLLVVATCGQCDNLFELFSNTSKSILTVCVYVHTLLYWICPSLCLNACTQCLSYSLSLPPSLTANWSDRFGAATKVSTTVHKPMRMLILLHTHSMSRLLLKNRYAKIYKGPLAVQFAISAHQTLDPLALYSSTVTSDAICHSLSTLIHRHSILFQF